MVAALRSERNSIGVEIDPEYCRMAAQYLKAETEDFFTTAELRFESFNGDTRHGSGRQRLIRGASSKKTIGMSYVIKSLQETRVDT